jgi:hypothetical protein
MLRAALFTLLAASILGGAAQAQHAGSGFHGGPKARPGHSGIGGRRGLQNRPLSRRGLQRGGFYDGYGSFFLPYDEASGYDQSDAETPNAPERRVFAMQRQEPPVPKSQVIEIPRVAGSAAAKEPPPTIFVLASGERLETRRFVLTANLLTVNIDRQRRTVPLDKLDINATLSSNRDRGIDLRIPDDRNEISVSF